MAELDIRSFIKGKITEVIFEMMFREAGKFVVIRNGYEYTLPMLAQFDRLKEVQNIVTPIRKAPDFLLISKKKAQVFLVRSNIGENYIQTEYCKFPKNFCNNGIRYFCL